MKKPSVTIGLPVYNGGLYLESALDSLLSQTYEHFEILISNNASTDNTEDICLSYKNKDSRIKYIRNEINIGMLRNFNELFKMANSEFFMWAAHDDIWEPHFLELAYNKLVENPSASMCTCIVNLLDGETTLPRQILIKDSTNLPVIERPFCGWFFYGLYRRELLAKTRLLQETHAADILLLVEICLLGGIAVVDKPLLNYRLKNGEFEYYLNNLDISEEQRGILRRFPYTTLTKNLIHVVDNSYLTNSEKNQLKIKFLEHFEKYLYGENNQVFLENPNLTLEDFIRSY